jgi:4-aminobutyrate aminotransferase-like enzyme
VGVIYIRQVLQNENLAENAQARGEQVRYALEAYKTEFPFVKAVRGKGLLNAIDIDPKHSKSAW